MKIESILDCDCLSSESLPGPNDVNKRASSKGGEETIVHLMLNAVRGAIFPPCSHWLTRLRSAPLAASSLPDLLESHEHRYMTSASIAVFRVSGNPLSMILKAPTMRITHQDVTKHCQVPLRNSKQTQSLTPRM